MGHILKKATGCDGVLELLDNRVRIKRDDYASLLMDGVRSDRVILLNAISSVQLKRADLLANGYLRFVLSLIEGDIGKPYLPGKDADTIEFTRAQQPQFEEMKSVIEARISGPLQKKRTQERIQD